MARWLRRYRYLIALAALGALIGTTSGTYASFRSTTSTPGSGFSSKRIFSGTRSWSFYGVSDAADNSASDESWMLAAADSNYYKTKNWALKVFDTSRYMDLSMNSPLPAGIAMTGSTLNMSYSDDPGGGGESACYYFEVRRKSTDAVVSTHGSSSSPIDCEAGNVTKTVSTPIPSVNNTDISNDLYIRAYFREDGGKALRVDGVTISGSYLGVPFTQYASSLSDLADGSSASTAWGLPVAGDSAVYQSVGNWNANFASNRWIDLASPSPGYVPNGSAVSSVSFQHSYKSASNGDTTCWYFEVYDGLTLLGSHGSSTVPVSCNATTAFVTDTVSLPEVTTAAAASTLRVRIYAKVTGGHKSQHDLARLNVTYALSATGCTNPGSTPVAIIGDSWVQEDNVDHTAGGDTTLDIKAQATKARRTLFQPATLPTIPAGCSFTSASFQVFSSSAEGARTLELIRAASPWTEAGVTWTTKPGSAGSKSTAPSGPGWIEFDVTAQVSSWYGGAGRYGFYVQDSNDADQDKFQQNLHSRENTNVPVLVITTE